MAEEFEESEVIFSDSDNNNNNNYGFKELDRDHFCSNNKKSKKKNKKSCSSSVPVNIPSNVFIFSESDNFKEDYDGENLIPPHLIIGRRIEGKKAFSVCSGDGRTLKGRDLSRVRNSILRLTGFLES